MAYFACLYCSAPSPVMTSTAPVSSMEGLSLHSPPPAQGTIPAAESPMAIHQPGLGGLGHVRPPPGHGVIPAPAAAADQAQQQVRICWIFWRCFLQKLRKFSIDSFELDTFPCLYDFAVGGKIEVY